MLEVGTAPIHHSAAVRISEIKKSTKRITMRIERNLIQICLLGAVACRNSLRRAAEPVPSLPPNQTLRVTLCASTAGRGLPALP
jgi:hypothetical protein